MGTMDPTSTNMNLQIARLMERKFILINDDGLLAPAFRLEITRLPGESEPGTLRYEGSMGTYTIYFRADMQNRNLVAWSSLSGETSFTIAVTVSTDGDIIMEMMLGNGRRFILLKEEVTCYPSEEMRRLIF